MSEALAEASSPKRPGAVLQNPRPRSDHDSDTDTREALELREIQTHEDDQLEESAQSNSSGDEYRVVTRRTTSRAAAARVESRRRRLARKGAWGKFARFWTHHVTLTVPHKSNRDYFALERTFLAYIRTSLVITQQGVLIAQLFRLTAAEALADRLGFYRVGVPLSVTCHCVAIVVALVGAFRFWRQQNAIARGKIHAGGWELNSVGILLGCIVLTMLIVCVAIVVEDESDPSILVFLGYFKPNQMNMRAKTLSTFCCAHSRAAPLGLNLGFGVFIYGKIIVQVIAYDPSHQAIRLKQRLKPGLEVEPPLQVPLDNMSTLNEVMASRHRVSVYHVYHKGEEHVSITPFINSRKDLGCTKKEHKKMARKQGAEPDQHDPNSYFVHKPCLAFHDAPRTLRRGNFKRGPPVCIMNCGAFWRNWNIQFGPDLRDIIDPRGVVKWEHRSNPSNITLNGDRALKGYKVRTWRLWGNTGKEYHRQVNYCRKAKKQKALEKNKEPEVVEIDPIRCDDTTLSEKRPGHSKAQVLNSTLEDPILQPAVAEEAVRLVWGSPLSLSPRQYSFKYAGITFVWEGTREIQPDRKWTRRLMPFHHLRLLARLPGRENEPLLIAQYTSSFAYRKFGELWVFDSVLSDILKETGDSSLWSKRNDENEIFQLDPDNNIRETRLFDVVMATAMCMIISEWQKRMVLLMILAIAGEGGS